MRPRRCFPDAGDYNGSAGLKKLRSPNPATKQLHAVDRHSAIVISFQESKVKVMSDQEKRSTIISELCVAYWMEMETVMNFIACSINLDGVRAEEIKSSLQADIAAEMIHAQLLAKRIKTVGGIVPGSASFVSRQDSLQPPKKTTDVVSVIKGVIAAEDSAIAQYSKIIKLCDGFDYVTQDLCITALGDEEEHRREFMGFLAEYEG